MDNSIDRFKEIGNEKLPSVINNPFTKNHITSIKVMFEKNLFSDEWQAKGYIHFNNNNTDGTQKFTAPTFDEVVLQMKACINQLLNKNNR
jgi:hypothetical protein